MCAELMDVHIAPEILHLLVEGSMTPSPRSRATGGRIARLWEQMETLWCTFGPVRVGG